MVAPLERAAFGSTDLPRWPLSSGAPSFRPPDNSKFVSERAKWVAVRAFSLISRLFCQPSSPQLGGPTPPLVGFATERLARPRSRDDPIEECALANTNGSHLHNVYGATLGPLNGGERTRAQRAAAAAGGKIPMLTERQFAGGSEQSPLASRGAQRNQFAPIASVARSNKAAPTPTLSCSWPSLGPHSLAAFHY